MMLFKMARSLGDEKRQQSTFSVKASSLDLRRLRFDGLREPCKSARDEPNLSCQVVLT